MKWIFACSLFVTFASAAEQVNLVDEGKELFQVMGCAECHSVWPKDAAVKSGPSLYDLFRQPAKRHRVRDAQDQEKEVTADFSYLVSSLRQPASHRAGAYPAIMPAFPESVLSQDQVRALWHYLHHQAETGKNGPAVVMGQSSAPRRKLEAMDDPNELLVGDRALVQRAPVFGASARAVHVGLPTGYHFSFDPRHLSVRRVWSGGFLQMKKERTGRSVPGSDLGQGAQTVLDSGPLLWPMAMRGELVDLAFKQPDLGDDETIARHLWKGGNFLEELASWDVDFRGYDLSAAGLPTFRFRIGPNEIAQTLDISASGQLTLTMEASIKKAQSFLVRNDGISAVKVEGGALRDDVWTLSVGEKQRFVLRAQIVQPGVARVPLSKKENWQPQACKKSPSKALLPPGYRVEQWSPPRDLWGRKMLFEPTAIAVAADGTIVVGTRTAGIWRLRDGKWHCFVEGSYECLGLLIEDERGDVIVIAQKPEVTRITDRDGDGRADRFETVCDDFGFHGDYHEYTHGLLKDAEGNLYITLNLCHSKNARASYKAGGNFMGSMGGYRGWVCRVTPQGKFEPYAPGLRSPAGLGQFADGTNLVVDNQGEYFGASKIFALKRDAFYGHPSSLVSLPKMKPSSTPIRYEFWKERAERCALWFPHNRYANSPGHLALDQTQGKFGPYAGQMFIGDQTLSTLMRVDWQRVDGTLQGSVMMFGRELSSGLMRPCFLPDGSLLLGQTGRGWAAKGGQPAALQRIVWEGKTTAADVLHLRAHPQGILVTFTSPLKKEISNKILLEKCQLASWTYLDRAAYGSPEHEARTHVIREVEVAEDRRSMVLRCDDFSQPAACLDRIYHFQLQNAASCFAAAVAREEMDAYLTLRALPK
jgi:hypothetical protein